MRKWEIVDTVTQRVYGWVKASDALTALEAAKKEYRHAYRLPWDCFLRKVEI